MTSLPRQRHVAELLSSLPPVDKAWHALTKAEQDHAWQIWQLSSAHFEAWFGIAKFARVSRFGFRRYQRFIKDSGWEPSPRTCVYDVLSPLPKGLVGKVQPCAICGQALPLKAPEEQWPWRTFPILCTCGHWNMRVPWWRSVEPEIEERIVREVAALGLQWKQQIKIAKKIRASMTIYGRRLDAAAKWLEAEEIKCLDCGKPLGYRRSRQVRCPDCQKIHAAELHRLRQLKYLRKSVQNEQIVTVQA